MFSSTGAQGKSDPIDRYIQHGRLLTEALDPLPEDLAFFPDGWMTELELQVLYNFGKYATGDFLEIGPWIGRSTTAISLGRRDAGPTERKFDTADFGFVSLEEFCASLVVGMDYASGPEIAGPVLTKGGTVALLLDNLKQRNLLSQVTSVIRGNALDVPLRTRYGIIFCDAVHSEYEINLTGPLLAKICQPGTWLVCDDLHTEQKLVDALQQHVQFESLVLLGNIDPKNKAAIGRVRSTTTA